MKRRQNGPKTEEGKAKSSEIFRTYRRDFTNLALQEHRLRNQRKADIAELTQLQKDRAASIFHSPNCQPTASKIATIAAFRAAPKQQKAA